MNVLGIVYSSDAVKEFSENQLRELCQRAAEKNRNLDITGYLYYEKQRFIQYIEGEVDPLRRLMATIQEDPRHEVFFQLHDDQLCSRRFPNWSMRWVRSSSEIRLENILGELLQTMSRLPSGDSYGSASAWRLVDRVREFSV